MRRLYRDPNAPQPMRSTGELRRRKGLSGRDRHKVEVANAFVDFTLREAQKSVDAQRGIAMENPLRSWLWSFPQLESLRKDVGWVRVEYDACIYSGARCKAQAIEGNMAEMVQLRGKCKHIHSPGEWEPQWAETAGRWVYPSKKEAEYMAKLAFAMAVAMSWWAVRVKGVKMIVLGHLRKTAQGAE